MRITGMRGMFSSIVAWAAIVLLFFSASSSLYLEQNDKTLLKIQASRELSEKTENLVRLLDKATANWLYDQGNTSTCSTPATTYTGSYMESVLGNFNSNEKPYECTLPNFSLTAASTSNSPQTGTLECSVTIGGAKISEKRDLTFSKKWETTANNCTVTANPSNIQGPITITSADLLATFFINTISVECSDGESTVVVNPRGNEQNCIGNRSCNFLCGNYTKAGNLIVTLTNNSGQISKCFAPIRYNSPPPAAPNPPVQESTSCILKDSVSNCEEQPSFSC